MKPINKNTALIHHEKKKQEKNGENYQNEKDMTHISAQIKFSGIKELNNCSSILNIPNKHILYIPDVRQKIALLRTATPQRILFLTEKSCLEKTASLLSSIYRRLNTNEKFFINGSEGKFIFSFEQIAEMDKNGLFRSKPKNFLDLIIFDINSVSSFCEFIERFLWIENFITIGITSSPCTVVELRSRTSIQICTLASNPRFFYREMLKKDEIIFHTSNDALEGSADSLEEIAEFLHSNYPQLLTNLRKLVTMGAFSISSFVATHRSELGDDSRFFSSFNIRSTKLGILAEVVNAVDNNCIIAVNDRHLVPYLSYEVGDRIAVFAAADIPDLRKTRIINFSTLPISNEEPSYLFLSEDEEQEYRAIMEAEEQLEELPRCSAEGIQAAFEEGSRQITEVETENNIDNDTDRNIYFVCRYRDDLAKLLSARGFTVTKTLNRMFIRPPRTPKEIVDFGYRLASLINYPISPRGFAKIRATHVLFVKYVSFGHLINFNFFNPRKFFGRGLLYFTHRFIIILFITRELTFKVEIDNCLEKYLYIDIRDNYLNIYLLLRNIPRLFISKNNDITRLDSLFAKYRQGPQIFDVLDWNRATSKDIDFIQDRYDIRVNIDLSLPCNAEYNIPEIKNINNIKDAILNILVMYSSGVYLCPITEHNHRHLGLNDVLQRTPSFDDRYLFLCLFSRKGRFVSHKFSEEHIDRILRNKCVRQFCDYIEMMVDDRNFEPEKIVADFFSRGIEEEENQDSVLLRSAIITPLSIIYNYPKASQINRVLREFNSDKFIRISFREDNTLDRLKTSEIDIYDYFRDVLNEGLLISDRKYFFLASSASQLRLHSAWFVTPYIQNGELIGPDYIRSWLGDFSEIHNIGKYTIRLGQALSATLTSLEINHFKEEPDIISKTGYCFTDGVGKISPSLCQQIADLMNLTELPSAFQIRFAGYKGVVTVDPSIETGLVLRPSMRKFESSHRKIEVVSWSQEIPAHLNRQIILILESLGIPQNVFTDLHEECVFYHIFSTPHSVDFLEQHCLFFKPTSDFMHMTFFQKLLIATYNRQLADLHKKEKIFLKKGRILMGVIDEQGCLAPEEVFLMTKIDGVYVPITGKVLVAKNPCLHPGDIRIVIGVDKPQMYHLKNVLVFSRLGERPIFNMCSGSDLDGDLYFCSWEPRLFPPRIFEADSYVSACHLYKSVVSMTDIVNFYIKFMRDNELGAIANAHLAFSDQKPLGVTEPESLKLANLFNQGIDFPKTGYVARLPIDLNPKAYPDFMGIRNYSSYESQKTLGILYRRSRMLQFANISLCDCKTCISKSFLNEVKILVNGIMQLDASKFDCQDKSYTFMNYDTQFYRNIKASNSYRNIHEYLEEAKQNFNDYQSELNGLIKKYGYLSEEEFFLGYLAENDEWTFEENRGSQKSIIDRVKIFIKKYRERFFQNCNHENFLTKMMAWYEVSRTECGNGSSFPWILDIFNRYSIPKLEDKESLCRNYSREHVLNNKLKNDKENLKNNMINNDLIKKNDGNYTDIIEGDEWKQMFINEKIRFEESLLNPYVIFIEDSAKARKILKTSKPSVCYRFMTRKKVQCSRIFIFGHENINARLRKTKNQKVYVELFNLLFAIDFFPISEIDDSIVFLFKLIDEIGDSPREKIRAYVSQRLFSLSKASVGLCYTEKERNKLIAIASVLFIDLPLISKMKLLRQYLVPIDPPSIPKERFSIKPSSFNGISIMGMFDPNDEIYFSLLPESESSGRKIYELNLLNDGTADISFYKDDLRKFLLGHIWHFRDSDYLMQIRITPGRLIFYSLLPKFAYNNMRIRDLNAMLYPLKNKNEFKHEKKEFINGFFRNECPLKSETEKKFENEHFEEFKTKHPELIKESFYDLSLQRSGHRYGIYFKQDGVIYRITRRRILLGKYEIIDPKTRKDNMIEAITEEVIFDLERNIDILEIHEKHLKMALLINNELSTIEKRELPTIEKQEINHQISTNNQNSNNHKNYKEKENLLRINDHFTIKMGEYGFIRLEILIPIKKKGPFVSYKQFLFNSKNGKLTDEKVYIRVYSDVLFFMHDLKGHCDFEEYFEKIWNNLCSSRDMNLVTTEIDNSELVKEIKN